MCHNDIEKRSSHRICCKLQCQEIFGNRVKKFENLWWKLKQLDVFQLASLELLCIVRTALQDVVFSRPMQGALDDISSGSRRSIVQEHLIELSVGDTIHIGEYTVTIVAVEGDELCFEIVDDGQNESDSIFSVENMTGTEDILIGV